MTWKTQEGMRTLAGAEANLIREAMHSMAELIELETLQYIEPWDFGIQLFDELTPIVRLKLLAQVSWALLRETDTFPPLSAINEAAVGAMFFHIRRSVQFEIEQSDDVTQSTFWRVQVLNVLREIADDEELPEPESEDLSDWNVLIEFLRDQILWDEDFTNADLILDAAPEQADMLKTMMAIDPDYFATIPPDAEDTDLPQIKEMLRDLYRRDN